MLHSFVRRVARLATILAGTALCAGSLVTPVAAREAVDPALLNPPLPWYVDPVCGWSGQEVICASDDRFQVVDVPTGVICDGHELLETSARRVIARRYYDSDLNLVRRDITERIDGILYDPVTGVSVRWTGYNHGSSTFSVPGDPGTGTRIDVGAGIHVYLEDGRSYSLAAGRWFENVDTEEFSFTGTDTVDFCAAIAANT